MKRTFSLLTALLVTIFLHAQNGYEFHVKVKEMHDTAVYLGHHYGDKQYVIDTVMADANGEAVFKGPEMLDGGIYLIVYPKLKNRYFEFIVSGKEHKFSMETDTADFIKNMKISGSTENKVFYEDLNFISEKRKISDDLKARLKETGDSTEEGKSIKEQLEAINKDVEQERSKMQEKYPDLFYTKFVKAVQEIEVPRAPTNPDGSKDSTFAYRYVREHFFDNVDFTDERMLRTSLFSTKMNKYLHSYVPQSPDSIDVAVDYIINKASVDKEVFKYVTVTLLNDYATSKIMGMDAVYVHIVDAYYKTGKAFWLDDTGKYKIENQADRIRPTLIGKTAPNIILQDTAGANVPLYSVNSKYTIIVFWDVDCGHCKKEMPKLLAAYPDIKQEGGEVYAVYVQEEWDKWKKWLLDNQYPWINVGNINQKSDFQARYNVDQTPTILILDEQKKIIAKKIGADQILDILKHYNELPKGN